MHLAIDAVGAKHGGAAVVVLDTLRATRDVELGQVTLFCSPTEVRRFELPRHAWLRVEERPREERSPMARLGWLTRGLGRAARAAGADALLALNGARAEGIATTVLAQQAIPLDDEAMNRLALGDHARMIAVRALLSDACRHARVAVQANWMRDALIERLGASPDRVVVVGTAATPMDPAGEAPAALVAHQRAGGDVILYVGSDSRYKNIEVLAPAMRLLTASRPQARLFATIEPERAAACGATPLGYLSRPELAGAYASADILVFPSLVESAGLPLIEAMSMGTPVVAADRPYAHDMCGGAALFFDANDPEVLADRLVQLLFDGGLRTRLRAAGLVRAESFRAARPYERLVELAIRSR